MKRMKGLPPLKDIFYIGIVSSIIYCIATWGSCPLSIFNELEQSPITAAKLINNMPSEVPNSDVLKLVKCKALNYIYKRRFASIMYQAYHNSSPEKRAALLEIRSNENSCNLRHMSGVTSRKYGIRVISEKIV